MTKIILYTAFALTAFAFNSILCRLALRGGEADAVGFTVVRLLSGAAVLVAITFLAGRDAGRVKKGSWGSALCLFAYAACFSLAYLGLTAGTGALILFGSVQIAMVVAAAARGDRPRPIELIGLVVALAGLVYLVLPGLTSPPLISSLMMAAAGAAWGFYTLRGRGSADPLGETAGNFIRTVPFAIAASVVFFPSLRLTDRGILLAIISGAVTSGIGYAVWYTALRYHTSTRAAVLQLSVPVLTAVIGVIWLGETASATLLIASIAILGGIALVVVGRVPPAAVK